MSRFFLILFLALATLGFLVANYLQDTIANTNVEMVNR